MRMKVFEIVQNLFKFSCFTTVICMVSLWVHKYMQDGDLCLVDYKALENTVDLEFPDVSLCFLLENAFIQDKLTDLNTTTWNYIHHLWGNLFNENLTKIDYNEVTLNLQDYYERTVVTYRNGTHNLSQSADVSIHETTNDFTMGLFRKCFTIDTTNVNMDNAKSLSHVFSRELFQSYIKSKIGKVIAMVHHQDQLLLGDSFDFLSDDRNGSNSIHMGIFIEKVEILRRRNKRKEPCSTSLRNWDQLAQLRYTKDVGCSAPYQKSLENIATCSTQNKMKEWSNFSPLAKIQKDYQPCQGIPRVDFELSKDLISFEDSFMLTAVYPNQVKIVTQSRAVDVNALIGNIGGYIGLFLGMFYYHKSFAYRQAYII